MKIVTLNSFEMRFARKMGQARQERRMKEGRRNRMGSAGGAEDHIIGCMGEMAFAKHADKYPSGLFLDMAEDDDVGGIQVRTRRQHYMDLYLWESDPEDAWYALLTGTGPEFQFHGVVWGVLGKVKSNWTEAKVPFPRVDCYIVPRKQLITDLSRV